MKKSVAGQHIAAMVVSATDGSAVTSGVAVVISGDGGAQGASGGTLTHLGGGHWDYAPTQAETNYDHIAFVFSKAGAISVVVQAFTTFPQTGDSFARLGAPAGASVSADVADLHTDLADVHTDVADIHTDVAAVKTDTGAVKTKTDQLAFTAANKVDANALAVGPGAIGATSFGVGAVDAASLATDAGQEIADRVLARSIAGGADTGRTIRQALQALRNKVAIALGTMTVYAEDDSTPAWTASVATTAGDPISSIDPA